jgi:hypothetical protein
VDRRFVADPRFLADPFRAALFRAPPFRPPLFRALARIGRLRAEPRFLPDRDDFFAREDFLADRDDFLAADFLAFLAMDLSSNRDRDEAPQQDSGKHRRVRVVRACRRARNHGQAGFLE